MHVSISEVEFVAPGHPLLEAVNQQILSGSGENATRYAVFGDPEGQRKGVLWFVEGEVTDGTGLPAGKRVFCLYQPLDGEIQKINPAVLWDLEPLKGDAQENQAELVVSPQVTSLLERRNEIDDYVITQVLLPFRDEIAERRDHEDQIKEKYGLRSLDYLIQESNGKILDYQERQSSGENMDMPLLNEQRNLENLQQRRKDLEREIRLERNLTIGEPRLLGAAVVMPLPVSVAQANKPEGQTTRIFRDGAEPEETYQITHTEARDESNDEGIDTERKAEIEAMGMRVAMANEREQGWTPEDVSGENHGFDIRSTKYDENGSFEDIRYIEVKARAESGAIRVSANEWKKARHLEEKYWLYVVTHAATGTPMLNCIQNPQFYFRMDEDIFAAGYIIPLENLLNAMRRSKKNDFRDSSTQF